MSAKAYEALSKSNELTPVSEAAQSPEQRNDDEKEQKKRIRGTLIKFGSLAVFAFIVWVFATISWFSSNSSVSGSGMGVSVGNGNFELRFSGDNVGAKSYTAGATINGVTQYTASDIYGKVTPTSDFAYDLGDGAETNISGTNYYDTDGNHTEVILRLNQAYPADPKKDTGLNPGSEGEIQFWVVPKKSGTFTVKFSFELLGYTADQSDTVPLNVNSLTKIPSAAPVYEGTPTTEQQKLIDTVNAQIQAERYLNTHILFFKGTYNSSDGKWYYNGADAFVNDDMLTDGSFSITFTDAVADTPYEVRIKWVWPNTLKQMIFVSGEGEAESITDNSTAIAQIQQFACDNYSTLLKDVSDRTLMMTHNNESNTDTFNTTAATNNLETLSRGYNKADSEIGKNVNYMLLVMTAE